jgi:site-specific recombinase XerD
MARTAGRPYGSHGSVSARHRELRHAHFTFVRYLLEGLPVREAWERSLAFDGSMDDERHFARRLRDICRQIYAGARAFDLEHHARIALDELMRRRFVASTSSVEMPPAIDAPGGDPETPSTIWGDADLETRDQARKDEPPSSSTAAAPAIAVPTLDEWIEARCEQFDIDIDFQPYAEWLREYEEEFRGDLAATSDRVTGAAVGSAIEEASRTALRAEALQELDGPTVTRSALDGRPDAGDVDDVMAPRGARIDSLNALATLLAVPATIADPVEAWLSSTLTVHLRTVGVVTVANLADFIDLNGFRWHRRVPGLGAVRAARLVAWLSPLVQGLGRPLRAASLKPSRQLALARDRLVASLDPARLERYGLVPLERLAVPPELDGRRGTFRVQGPNVFDAQDDLTAIKCWLRRYEPTRHTHRAYLHAVEVFYLWSVCVRRKPLSSLVEADIHDFRSFLVAPPADWIQARSTDRASDDWRPLRGALSPASQRHLVTIVGALLSGLVDAGYISVQVVSGVKRQMKLPRPKVHVHHTFSDAQWRTVRAVIDEMPNTPEKRRLQLVMELASTSGLRLLEMCTARLGQLRQEDVPGVDGDEGAKKVWMLKLVGKGAKPREVLVFDDVKGLIDVHQVDLARLALPYDRRARVRTLEPEIPTSAQTEPLGQALVLSESAAAAEATPKADPELRPIVGALRRPVPRWKLGKLGEAVLDRDAPRGDAYGALDPSALYQSVKRVFANAAARHAQTATGTAGELEVSAFKRASTHWMRHFFATSAANDGVDVLVLKDLMGHASVDTTLLYVHPERRNQIAQMAKFRRRG